MGTRTWMRVVLTGAVVSLTAAALGGTSPAEGADGPTVAQYACQGATGYAASVPVAVDYLAYVTSRSPIATFTVGLTTPVGPVSTDAGTIEGWVSPVTGSDAGDRFAPVATGDAPFISAAPSGAAQTAATGPKLTSSPIGQYVKAARFTPATGSVYCGVYAKTTNSYNSPSATIVQLAGPTQP